MGTGVGMGLEHGNDPIELHFFHRVKQRFDLTGMMSIVVVNYRTTIFPFELKSTTHAEIRIQTFHDCGHVKSVLISRRHTSQSV